MAVSISEWLPAPARAPRPAFAIGDVHGQADLLSELHAAIADIARTDELQDPMLVHLGDYIDRGPSSIEALSIVARGIDDPAFEQRDLMGNHEQFLLALLNGPERERIGIALLWLRNGGKAVLAEAGLSDYGPGDADLLRDALLERLAGPQLDLLNRLESHARCGRYLFVHAGIPPRQPLDVTFADGWDRIPVSDSDAWKSPLWIRNGFLDCIDQLPDGVIVVHGHTISKYPDPRFNRIGIDTGAYRSRTLTAIELRDDTMRFIQTVDE